MNWYIIPKEDDLMHFGIKGQKWGIRRFQNPDGTLTDAGKKRYGKKLSKIFIDSDREAFRYHNLPKGKRTFTKAQAKREYMPIEAAKEYYDNMNNNTKNELKNLYTNANNIENEMNKIMYLKNAGFRSSKEYPGDIRGKEFTERFKNYLKKTNAREYDKFIKLEEQYTNTNKKIGEIITNDIKNKLGEDWYNSSYDSLFFKRQMKYGDELLDNLKYAIDR